MSLLDSKIDMSNYKEDTYQPYYVQLGTVSSNFTLEENKTTIASITGNYTMTLPTITDLTNEITCILDFSTNNASYPSITNSNIKLKGVTSLTYSTTADSRNRLVCKSINGSDCWMVYLERYYV